MSKLAALYRSIGRRSLSFSASSAASNHHHRHLHSSFLTSPTRVSSEFQRCLVMGTASKRFFSEDVNRMPNIKDSEIELVIKNLIAASWDDLPDDVVRGAKNALSKSTDDKAGQEALANALRAAEAIEEFTGILMSLKTVIDDSIGLSGENVKPLPEEYGNAYRIILQRYNAYLQSFGPEEGYLKKKVENELGTRMIYLKMRCSGLSSEWGKVSVLGTSGIAGSYIEQRALS